VAQHPQQAHPVMAVQVAVPAGMTTIHPLEVEEEVMGLHPPVQALMGEVEIVMGVAEGATEALVMEVLMGVTAVAAVAMEVHLVAAEAMAAATAVDHLVAAVAMEATAAAVEAMEAAAVVAAEALLTAAAAVAMEAAVEVATAAEASVAAAAAEVVEEAAMVPVKTKSSLTTKSMPLASQPTSQKKTLPHFLAQLA